MRIGRRADPIAARAATATAAATAVLELGTLRSDPQFATHHRAWVSADCDYVMSDVAAGVDVDEVADAHNLPTEWSARFDAVIAVSVWEHLARPWVAASEVARVLRPGGFCYISTHQTFPLHGYPNDYFRFSTDALSLLFTDAGLVEDDVGYEYPATITPPKDVTRWNVAAPAFLNVAGMWRKP